MAHQVLWTNKVLEAFIEEALLNEDEEYIMRSRAKNTTVSAQALHLHCSEARVNRIIANLKVKYDAVQKEHPDKFPERKSSAKELYMDSN